MLYNLFIIATYIFLSFFLFNIWENVKIFHIPFFSILILLIFFLSAKIKYFKIFSILLSFLFLFFSFLIFSNNFYIPFILLILLWLNYYFFKNPKILFILNILYGFFLFLSIFLLKELSLPAILISLHYALVFSLSLINNTLYFNQNPNFPYAHFIPVLFGVTGIVFIILRIYSYILFIPFFILLSVSIYATLYQPPYKKPYPLLYQLCIFFSMALNYFGINL